METLTKYKLVVSQPTTLYPIDLIKRKFILKTKLKA
jgi:hypothetical protein